MTQEERRMFLIRYLLKEDAGYRDVGYQDVSIPKSPEGQQRLLRGLLNIRPPKEASAEFLAVQDAYLQEAIQEKGVTDWRMLAPAESGIYLWQGDITTLRCGAIVNAANAQMLGCFRPNHTCIDNCIHTFAGIQLRAECDRIMRRQGHDEETGQAKITSAYNLPCEHVIHTVGPIVQGRLTKRHEDLLASCYRSCLELVEAHHLPSLALCCISTGVFGFPNQPAAQIAVHTVRNYRRTHPDCPEVIFNVFKDEDAKIYGTILGEH